MTIQTNIKETLNKYNEKIDSYLAAVEKCNTFLTNHRTTPEAQKSYIDLFFNKVFKSISEDLIGNYKVEHQKVINQTTEIDLAEEKEISEVLNSLSKKAEQCELVTKTFRDGIIQLLYRFPQALLYDKSMLGFRGMAGTQTIGECHCCEQMNRDNRSAFTASLVSEIKQNFPEKTQIKVASIGAGHCFHELTIHAYSAKQGLQVGWILNDPNITTNCTGNNSVDTVSSFTMMANWITPTTTVEAVATTAEEFFRRLETQNEGLPDVFLFMDVDQHFTDQAIHFLGSKMKHSCLFATFAKNIEDLEKFRMYPEK